ncbi:hypothetical protein N9J07_05065 [Bacteroidia bacterium]|nr:hypothetical protein [Bacteroidia bacterium]
MKNILKLSFLVLLTAVMVTLVGCGSETGPIPTLGPYEHSGFISADETWNANDIHILKDRVIVQAGVTLTIEPGAIIKSEDRVGPSAALLVIARGATINAAGTATQPIIFTSIADEIQLGDRVGPNLNIESDKGFWGGVIILGDAPISPKTGATEQVEGIPADVIEGNYGGDNPTSSSGVLTYVSIRHGGALIGEGNEINGLTLGGVGSGTVINHVEVVGNVDDGIECFGGTVNIDDAIVMYQGDDAYDIDQAYCGTINNFIYIAGATSDHGLEIDGPEGSENSEGSFILQNGSLKGNAQQGEFADFRSNAQGTVDGLYFFGFNTRADMELDDDKTSANYTADLLVLKNLKFNARAWTLDEEGQPNGGTTTWTMITDLFADKSDAGDAVAADVKFEANSNTLVTAKEGGADKTEFVGWSLADAKGLLSDF